jgi:putative protease
VTAKPGFTRLDFLELMMNNAIIKPELLSPAGSLEAFFAAMENGADAVYTGLKEFSARAKAKNFSLGDLEQMVGYAHQRQRRVYTTLNTLIKEQELPLLIETLASLEKIGVDGVILQDMTVWNMARQYFPNLALHSSTQMTIHNVAGVQMLEQLGFKRAVLARELSIEEIGVIRNQTSMELEHFVHGALCFGFSGQCYFSSWLGGKSGNRGRCAQPCRRRYKHRQDQGYYFSTNDLSAIDLLDDLQAAGVGSFKIEGRMKSAEYVANVVAAYRMVIDAPTDQKKQATQEAKSQLKESFGRPPTRGFLPGGRPTDIAVPSVQGATGQRLGKIDQVQGNRIRFKTAGAVHLGDRLRIQPQTDRAGQAFTIKEIFLGTKRGNQADKGTAITIPTPFTNMFQPGDAVFKVSSAQAFNMSDSACRRLLKNVNTNSLTIRLQISMPDAQTLHLISGEGKNTVAKSYTVESFPAIDRPLSTETLTKVFAKGGNEGIILAQLEATDLPPVVIPPSRLKEIRRDFYAAVQAAHSGNALHLRSEQKKLAHAALLPATDPVVSKPKLTVAIRDIKEANLLENRQVDRVIIPVTPGLATRADHIPGRLAKQTEKLIWDLPFIIFDQEWESYRSVVEKLCERGWRHFRLNNLSHFQLFADFPEAKLSTGYRLFSLNSQALLAWRKLGCVESTLYIEDDRENLSQILRREVDIETAVTVYAQVPLMTTRVPLPKVRPDSPVVSDRDEPYQVRQQGEISTLTAETDFSLLGHLQSLSALGCHNFIIETGHISPFTERGKQILEAFAADRPISGTLPFNFTGGME